MGPSSKEAIPEHFEGLQQRQQSGGLLVQRVVVLVQVLVGHLRGFELNQLVPVPVLNVGVPQVPQLRPVPFDVALVSRHGPP